MENDREHTSTHDHTNPQAASLEAALTYIRLGWPVLPLHGVVDGRCTCGKPDCGSPGKHPFGAIVPNGLKDATTDEATIKKWFSHGNHNVGIVCGAKSGFVVLDVDPRNGGFESLDEMETQHGKLPVTTPRQKTGGDGAHYLFEHPGGKVKNGTLSAGLDLKADNGYIVAYPSNHITGGTYSWRVDPRAPLAECPKWMLRESPAKGKTSVDAMGRVTEGARNDTLASLAGSMRQKGFTPQAILAALLEQNEKTCNPSLSQEEVRGIAASISRYAPSAEWEPPAPLGHFDLPEFPIEAFPQQLSALCGFCEAVAKSYQVPIDLVAMLVLTVGGAALAKKMKVHVQGDHVEPVNLFTATAMPPGTRKSAIFKVVTEPITTFERQEVERLTPIVLQNRNDRITLEKSLDHAQRQAAQAKKPEDRRQWRTRADELVAKLSQLEELKIPQLVGVAQLLSDNGGRFALMSPEGDVFDLMAGRYSNNSGPNLGVYLKGHAGDDLRVNRDRQAHFVCDPALTIGLAVQPDVIRGLAGHKGFRERGLLGRFLYSLPPPRRGHRKIITEAVEPRLTKAYSDLMRGTLQLLPALNSEGQPTPYSVRIAPTAMTVLNAFAAALEKNLRSGGELEAIRDWAGKLVGAVCRIAGILHGLMHASPQGIKPLSIDPETMLGSIAIGEYLVPHAQAAFFEMGADPSIDVARRILTWLLNDRRSVFTKRDAFIAVRGTIHKVTETDDPLRLLASHGYVRERPTEREGPGRKPSPEFDVNPLWLAQNAQNTHNGTLAVDSAYCAQYAQEVPV